MFPSTSDLPLLLPQVVDVVSKRATELPDLPTLPTTEAIAAALASLVTELPENGLGTAGALENVLELSKGLAMGHAGPRYMGFVTGGVLPAAQLADVLVSSFDQNVQVHLPGETISTTVEAVTLLLFLQLLGLPPDRFQGRTLTTGATASNVLGLVCGRDELFARGMGGVPEGWVIAEDGWPPSSRIEVLGVRAHASIVKAAALVGIGRRNVHDLGDGGLDFDLEKLEERLRSNRSDGTGSIIVVTFGEVNSGGFSGQMRELRALADSYGAWLHMDGCFGSFTALLPELQHVVEDMELVDSLTVDAHKWANVPYELGLFYTRSSEALPRSLGPSPATGAAAYLAPPTTIDSSTVLSHPSIPVIHSPLNQNIENSRRFRALPLYAALISLGRSGYTDLIRSNVALASRLRAYFASSPYYELLNPEAELNIVLVRGSFSLPERCPFHPSHADQGPALARAVNQGREVYVSATKAFDGKGAVRLAVGNWLAGQGGEQEWKRLRAAFDKVGLEAMELH